MPSKPLTKKQNRLLQFIKDYRKKNSFSPTLEVMKDYMGVASRAVVHSMLLTMERNGWITRKKTELKVGPK